MKDKTIIICVSIIAFAICFWAFIHRPDRFSVVHENGSGISILNRMTGKVSTYSTMNQSFFVVDHASLEIVRKKVK